MSAPRLWGTEKCSGSESAVPPVAGQFAIVQVWPGAASAHWLILAVPAASEEIFAPAAGLVPSASVAIRSDARSNRLSAALVSLAV